MFVLDVSRLERFCFHDEFKQEAPSREDIDRVSLKLSLSDVIGEFRSVTFDRSHSIGNVIDNRLALLIDEVASVPKIDYFDIEFGVQ